mgnify:CR=1 FL=1
MESPFKLQDAYKGYTDDQDKIISPIETVQRFKERLAHVNLDILAGTERIDSGRLGIPVFFSRCGRDAAALTGTKKQMGKGATPEQAEASAVMELAERFSFFDFINNPDNFIIDTHAKLKDRAVPIEMIARSVHDHSDDLEVAMRIYNDLPMRWTKGYNLTRKESILIPFDWFFAINEFNGPSAGNCREEAILQGICEIVERHVSSIVSRDRRPCPGIRPDSATDAIVKTMISKYRRVGIEFYLSDFTLDTGIPTVAMLAYDPVTHPHLSEIVWTAGTTPDPQKALSRALTEVAQLAGDFNSGSNYVASGLPKFADTDEAKYIMHPPHTIAITDLPDLSHENIRIEVENLINALAAQDMEVLVVDTMHPELAIPAFYTIVPSAHFRERAAGTNMGMFTAKLITQNFPPEQAARRLEEISRLMPEKYYIQFYLGSTHLVMGDATTALACFRKALAQSPPDEDIPSIYTYMGMCLKDMEKYKEALDVLRKGERRDRERTDILNLMGFCHFKLKAHERAIECFNKVLVLNPGSAIDYANIASNYREMGEIDKAREYYETALSLDPSIAFARENLVKLGRKLPNT